MTAGPLPLSAQKYIAVDGRLWLLGTEGRQTWVEVKLEDDGTHKAPFLIIYRWPEYHQRHPIEPESADECLRVPGETLQGADLSGANLERAHLAYANLAGANLYRANLRQANLLNALLVEANLIECQLQGAFMPLSFPKAAMMKANLVAADIRHANFEGADLAEADLTGADLSSCRLRDANLVLIKVGRDDGAHRPLEFHGRTPYSFMPPPGQDTNLAAADCHGALFSRGVGVSRAAFVEIVARGIIQTSQFVDPTLGREVRDQAYLYAMVQRARETTGWAGWFQRAMLALWRVTSDYGRSTGRWVAWSSGMVLGFSFLYTVADSRWFSYGDEAVVAKHTWVANFYYSVVTFTTLGFGDITPHPSAWLAQCAVALEVIVGYVMLGGLISLLATQLARRND